MFTVYILKDKDNKFYKGVTNNIQRRFNEHLRGKTKTTRQMIDIKIVHTEEYTTFDLARKREIYFKTAAGRRFLKKKGL